MIKAKRLSELAGYDSPVISACLKEALSNAEMLGCLPRCMGREQGFFAVTHRYLLHAYRYARELNHEREKWDPHKARQEFKACLYANERKAFLGCNPTDCSIFRPYFRYYDENMETLDVLLKFDELLGDRASMEDIVAIWTTLNETHWTGDHYYYKPTVPVYECETGFFLLAAYLNGVLGFALPHFDRCSVDLWSRLLKSQWDSPNWLDYVSRHADTNEQKRLNNTLITFSVLHAYYPLLPREARSAFRTLLMGDSFADGASPGPPTAATPAAQQTVAHDAAADQPAAWEGLVASHFAMDCPGRSLRIPVWKGSMGFAFGTQMASVHFARDGIYDLTFSQDWNRVIDSKRRGALADDGYRYVQRTELERNGTCP